MLIREISSPLEQIPLDSSVLLFCWWLLCPFREWMLVMAIKKSLISCINWFLELWNIKFWIVPLSKQFVLWFPPFEWCWLKYFIHFSLLTGFWIKTSLIWVTALFLFCRLSWLCGIQQDKKTMIDLDRFLIQILMLYLCVFQLIVLIV